MVGFPAIFFHPLIHLLGGTRRVVGHRKIGRAPLAAVARRAAEFVLGVGAIVVDKQIQTWMGTKLGYLRIAELHGPYGAGKTVHVEGELFAPLLAFQQDRSSFLEFFGQLRRSAVRVQLAERFLVKVGPISGEMTG